MLAGVEACRFSREYFISNKNKEIERSVGNITAGDIECKLEG